MSTLKSLANPWIGRLQTYEPGRPVEEVARTLGLADAESIIKLASNENALGPSPRAVEAMQRAAGAMHLYPDGGAFYLRRALARKLGVRSEELVLGNGSNEIIELLARVFLQPGDNIVMADRAFLVYRLVAEAAQAEVLAVPMKNFTHDLAAMRAAIQPRTRLVFIGNPNNPTGTLVDGTAIDRFMDGLPDHVVVVLDEAYIELLPPGQQPDTLKYARADRPVFVLRTFSKTYGLAGLRIGYGVAPADGVELLNRVRQPFNVNAMAQAAALAALEDDDYVQRTRRLVKEERAWLESAVAGLGYGVVPSVTNFMLVQVGRGRACFDALMRQGVIIRPMDAYGLPEYIRVTVGTREQNVRLVAALAAWRKQEP
jgi:histidinol-phosphate aminotransferase